MYPIMYILIFNILIPIIYASDSLIHFNNVIEQILIPIPGYKTNGQVQFNGGECTRFHIGDISVELVEQEGNDIQLDISMSQVGFRCTLEQVVLRNSGMNILSKSFETVQVNHLGASIVQSIAFKRKSDSVVEDLPSVAQIPECSAQLSLSRNDISVNGGSMVWETLFSVAASIFDNQIENFLCIQLGSLITNALNSRMEDIRKYLEKQEKEYDATDQLHLFDVRQHEAALMLRNNPNVYFNSEPNDAYVLMKRIVDKLSTKHTFQSSFFQQAMRTLLGSDTGTLSLHNKISLYSLESKIVHQDVFIERVEIDGIPTLRSIAAMTQVGDFTYGNKMNFEHIKVLVHLRANTNPYEEITQDARVLHDHVTVSMELKNVEVDFKLLLALEDNAFTRSLSFGAFYNNPVSCMLKAIHKIDIPDIVLSVGEWVLPNVSSESENGLDHVIATTLNSVVTILGPSMNRLRNQVLTDFMSSLLQDGIGMLMHEMKATETDCPVYEKPTDEDTIYYNFAEEPIAKSFITMINDKTGLNRLVSGLDETLHVVMDTKVLREKKGGIFGDMLFAVDKFSLENWNTLHDIKLFIPDDHDPYRLLTSIQAGSTDHPFRLTSVVKLGLEENNIYQENIFQVALSFETIGIAIETLAKINKFEFASLPIMLTQNLNCILAKIDGGIEKFDWDFKNFHFDMTCIECYNPSLIDIAERSKLPGSSMDLYQNVDFWFGELFGDLISTEKWGSFKSFGESNCEHHNTFTSYLTRSHVLPVKVKLDATSEIVPSIPEGANTINILVTLACAIIIGICTSCALKIREKRLRRYAHIKLNEELYELQAQDGKLSTQIDTNFTMLDDPSINSEIDYENISNCDTEELLYNNTTPYSGALWNHPQLSILPKLFIPLGLMVCTGLFIIGHVAIGANVILRVEVAHHTKVVPSIGTFSLGESLNGIWEAGAYPLAILLALFSGVWPYSKILMLTFCWCTPTRWVGHKTRGNTLKTLDSLGKWSLIDLYVLLICVVAFHLEIQSPALLVLPEHFYYVSVRVIPTLGLISFTVGAILSLLVNNLIVYYQRLADNSDTELSNAEQLWRDYMSNDNDTAHSSLLKPKNTGFLSIGLEKLRFNKKPDNRLALIRADSAYEFEDERMIFQGNVSNKENNNEVRRDIILGELQTDKTSVMGYMYHSRRTPNDITIVERIGLKTKIVLSTFVIASLILHVLGGMYYSFSVNITGLVSIPMNIHAIGEDYHGSRRSFSEVSFVKSIMDASIDHTEYDYSSSNSSLELTPSNVYDNFAVYFFLSAVFFATAFVFPILFLGNILILWLYPLNLRNQTWWLHCSEVLSAWACADVFLVSVIFGTFELPEIGQFIIGNSCTSVKQHFDVFLFMAGFKESDCLEMESYLQVGSAYLVASFVLSQIACTIILQFTETVVDQRKHRIQKELDMYSLVEEADKKGRNRFCISSCIDKMHESMFVTVN